jgi:transcriptional regulator with AAA-type ATPase domain
MFALLQAAITHRPFARSIHKFNQSATAKWVPVNKSFITLSKIILRSAVERLGLTHAAITLRSVSYQGHRHLLLVSDAQDLQVAAAGCVEDFFISTQEANNSPFENFVAASAISLPLNFVQPQGQSQRLGYLVAQVASIEGNALTVKSHEYIVRELALVAEEIMRTIGRYQTRFRAIHIYGDQHYWIGNSNALRQLDQRIDQLAKGNQPVLIRADRGCGKVIAARSLHCLSRSDNAPFIESDCTEWEEGAAASILQSLHTCARGGTLFLRNVDDLTVQSFQMLRHFWLSAAISRFDSTHSLRLIMSLSRQDVQLPSYQSQWFAQYAQVLLLPTLAARPEDVRDLAQFFVREFALSPAFDLTEEAWQSLEASHQLTSVEQLKQVIQKLPLLAEGDVVSAAELQAALG